MTQSVEPPAAPPGDPSAEVVAPAKRELGPAGRFAAGVSEQGFGVDPDTPTAVPHAGLRLAALLGVLAFVGYANPWMLVVILAIMTMITLHEFGHFVMARRAGIKVTEFFLGFGPKIWSIRRGEVEYGIKLIPAGAYVKVIGMTNLEEVDPADEARTYRQKSFAQRIGVAVAGSTMHFLIAAVLIFVCLVVVGEPAGSLDPTVVAKQWTIASVEPGTGAALAGLRHGDRILSIDDHTIGAFSNLHDIAAPLKGRTVPITYERHGRQVSTTITIKPFYNWYLDTVVAGSGPARAKLRAGDQITEIAGAPTRPSPDLDPLLRQFDGKVVPVTYERDRGDQTVTHITSVRVDRMILLGNQAFLGIRATDPPKVRDSVLQGVVHTPGQFVGLARLSVGGLAHFFTPSGISSFSHQLGNANKNHAAQQKADATPSLDRSSSRVGSTDTPALRGSNGGQNRILSIVGLVQLGSQTGSFDPAALLYLFAVINVFIGLFNLTPLLPFDGGHVMIAVYEKIQERRLHRRRYFMDVSRLLPVVYAVVLVLGLLFVSTIYLDLANPLVVR